VSSRVRHTASVTFFLFDHLRPLDVGVRRKVTDAVWSRLLDAVWSRLFSNRSPSNRDSLEFPVALRLTYSFSNQSEGRIPVKNCSLLPQVSEFAALFLCLCIFGEVQSAQRTLTSPQSPQLASTVPSTFRWQPTFGGLAGVDGDVHATAVFDDGNGPALFVAGEFDQAGGVDAAKIAKWDGTRWTGLGLGLDDSVYSLQVFDDGSGPALFVGGQFSTAGGVATMGIAKWDGTVWSALGNGTNSIAGSVRSMAIFDDGGGAALYAGGQFITAGGVVAKRVAKWDGSSWTALAAGMDNSVFALATFDDGNGAALYAGGEFLNSGAVPVFRIAKWDGSAWSALGVGANDCVRSLAIFDDGNGDALYAGGDFTVIGFLPTSRIAKWNGSSWSPLESGITGFFLSLTVNAITVHDDGTGDALFVGGEFTMAGGNPASSVAKWDGSVWSGIDAIAGDNLRSVKTLAAFDDGGGERLIAGGHFDTASGRTSNNVAGWDSSSWEELKYGENAIGEGSGVQIRSQVVFDDGSGPALFVGGQFTQVGQQTIDGIAKWDGSNWSALGSGLSDSGTVRVYDMQIYDDGGGDALYVGGIFDTAGGQPANRIAKWDGTNWTPLFTGVDSTVFALEVFNDGHGEKLFVGGLFSYAGSIPAEYIAKWDGTEWKSLGVDLANNALVESLAVFDDGSGPALFAGGSFEDAGGAGANSIAKWDGTNWSPLGSGITGGGPKVIKSMIVFDDGTGPALFAGGIFSIAGGIPVNHLAKWDGANWSDIGSAIAYTSQSVLAFSIFDDGTGSALYVAGTFASAGGTSASNIVRWDGSLWSTLDDGVNAFAHSFATFDDGSGPALFVGGGFTAANDSGDSYLAKWGSQASSSLTSDIATLSLTTGGTQLLAMDGGAARAGWFYFMLGSVTGTTPGIDFGGGVVLPLNYDVFLNLTLFKPGLGAFGNYRGTLDGSGQALSNFNFPALMDPSLAGVVINHAFLAGSTPGIPEFASNPVSVTLVL
jgi:hypothetical protein